MNAAREPWHLDKRVPVVIVGAILAQTFGFGWWAATVSQRQETNTARITALETAVADSRDLATDIAVIKNNVETIKDSLRRLETQVDGKPGKMNAPSSGYGGPSGYFGPQ